MADLAPQSPEWWIARLWSQLDARTKRIRTYEDYYEGNQSLRFMTEQAREVFGHLFAGISINFCQLVVDTIDERLDIRGFRMSDGADLDADAAAIWEANDMDAQASSVHVEALVNEEAYVIVWLDPDDRETPVITGESPFEVIVERSATSRLKRRAALKRFVDDDKHWRATLYLPDTIYRYRSTEPVKEGGGDVAKQVGKDGFWAPFVTEGEEWPLPNPLGVVPVVPITNRPRLGAHQYGTSELKPAVAIQDIINKTVFDMMVASEFVAVPQRYMVNVDIPTDPLTDQPVQPFKAGANRVWFVKQADGTLGLNPSLGQFPQADLSPFVDRVNAGIAWMAAITKTPKHALIDPGGGTNLSGDTVKALEAPLVKKVRRTQAVNGVGWAEVMALAMRLKQGGLYMPDDAHRIEVDWEDPETRSEAQHVDALVKLGTLGVPEEQLWSDAGYTPDQVSRFAEMRKASPPPQPVRVTEAIAPPVASAPPPTPAPVTGGQA